MYLHEGCSQVQEPGFASHRHLGAFARRAPTAPASCLPCQDLPAQLPKPPGTQQQTPEEEPTVEKDVAEPPLTATAAAEVLEEESHLRPRAGRHEEG